MLEDVAKKCRTDTRDTLVNVLRIIGKGISESCPSAERRKVPFSKRKSECRAIHLFLNLVHSEICDTE